MEKTLADASLENALRFLTFPQFGGDSPWFAKKEEMNQRSNGVAEA
jgi:hypothetical protein